MRTLIALLAVVVVNMILLSHPGYAESTFTALGFPAGGTSSRAQGVSADGSTVVGYFQDGSGPEAFRWTQAGGMVGLGFLPGGTRSQASGISADASTVVGFGPSSTSPEAAWTWTAGAGMVQLVHSWAYGLPRAASADGSTVVGYLAYNPGIEAFRWTSGGGWEYLGQLGPAQSSEARAVSADGSIVVGRANSGSLLSPIYEGFVWTSGSGMVGGLGVDATGISADGSTIVGAYYVPGYGNAAYRWTSGTGMVGLGGHLPDEDFTPSRASAISADGSTIVGMVDSGSGWEPYIWDATNGMRELDTLLDLTGWGYCAATAISADGRTIVGYGMNPSSDWDAWVAVLAGPAEVPTLSTYSQLALVASVMAVTMWMWRGRSARPI